MEYTQVDITVSPEWSDIILAELSECGYESFLEDEKGFAAYIPKELFDPEKLKDLNNRYNCFSFALSTLEEKNWNELWEQNFEPVVIPGGCLIRAPFHKPDQNYRVEVIIEPKMAFGTGHHETTSLMMQAQLETDHKNKTVLDAGSGTGILSVLAAKLGAKEIVAYDVNDWAVKNIDENSHLNGINNIRILQGTISELSLNRKFDIVLANISKAVLMKEIPEYVKQIERNGLLFLSGYLQLYREEVVLLAEKCGLSLVRELTKDDWGCSLFRKP